MRSAVPILYNVITGEDKQKMSSVDLISNSFRDIFPPRRVKIFGAGRFGRIAAERLKPRFPHADFSISDTDQAKIDQISKELGIRGEVEECVQSLARINADDLWVIPAVPMHVSFEWTINELKKIGTVKRLQAPEEVDSSIPNPIRTKNGTLYTSFATFLCPDYCSEPDEICTHTGKERQGNLYDVLGSAQAKGFKTVVLRSWQLAAAVGGYPGRSLFELFETVRSKPGGYLVATSCRCHGVIDALEWASD